MNRRDFLHASAAGIALAATPFAAAFADNKPLRAGLIGCGWYGKCDLLRLLQVAPAEVVSLCDVDKKMLAEAADIVAGRQTSKKKPRTYADYRDMLKEKDLDVVFIGTPDHWHALPMIAAVEAGADVWVQKPISVDIAEGQAMVAAARRTSKVVQVGTQRRSTPHLIEARDKVLKEGKLGKIALVEIYCYYHMQKRHREPAGHRSAGKPSTSRDVDRPPPRCGLTTNWCIRGGWRARSWSGNGIVGDMCIHMLDMIALDAGPGLAQDHQFRGRYPGGQEEQGECHGHAVGDVRFRRSAGRLAGTGTWGQADDLEYPWGPRRSSTATSGTLKADVHQYASPRTGRNKLSTLSGKAVLRVREIS